VTTIFEKSSPAEPLTRIYEPLQHTNSWQKAQGWALWVQCILSITIAGSTYVFLPAAIAQAQEIARNELNRTETSIGRQFFEKPPHSAPPQPEGAPRLAIQHSSSKPAVQSIDSRPTDISRDNLKGVFGDDAVRLNSRTSSSLYASLTKDVLVKVQGGRPSQRAIDLGSLCSLRGQDFSLLAAFVSTPAAPSFAPLQHRYVHRDS